MKGKLTPSHLERQAYVYVRQSTARQVFEHGESTKRQYGLAERALSLGWSPEAVEIVDEDLGRSGKTTDGRTGFARLAEAVAHGQAGAVLALEVSRLARSSVDWQQLLSLCAVAEVAVIDEQTVYDPGDKDDKLLLDLKGTMSEAELNWLALRLHGARRSKAGRGELWLPPPTGYVWNDRGLVLDPDVAVQRAVRLVFERFSVEPSAWAVVKWAHETGFRVPSRHYFAGGSSEVRWQSLGASRLCNILHNPVYAGAYAYGRRPERQVLIDGEIRRVRPSGNDPDEWAVLIQDAHAGYITWETYLKNRDKLRANDSRRGGDGGGTGAPREGDALLPGLLICGRCGRRMRVSYHGQRQATASYFCAGATGRGGSRCWSLPAAPIDAAVEELFLSTMVPSELELCLAVEREADGQAESLAEQWRVRIEKAEYDARLAERRYMAVDPDNRVVARTLECDWELRLRELEEVKRRYEEARRERRVELTDDDRARIRALARDLPAVWRSPTTKAAERKAMLRLVIEAVSLQPVEVPRPATRVKVQWQSGTVSELQVPRLTHGQQLATPAAAEVRIRELAAQGLHDETIAQTLNQESVLTGAGQAWNVLAVRWARRRSGIERTAPDMPRRLPLPDQHPDGRYSVSGAAKRFAVGEAVVRGWIERGLVSAVQQNFQQHRNVWWLEIDDKVAARLEEPARRARLNLQGVDNVRRGPLPEQHPDGRYSVRGAALRFDVSEDVVRRWIGRGLITATRQDYGQHRNVWWLEIDEATTARLEKQARQARAKARVPRANRRSSLPDQHPDGRYSVSGLVRRFGVNENVVRGWLRKGLVSGSREDYGQHRNVWWLEIDDVLAERLEREAEQARARARASKTTQS